MQPNDLTSISSLSASRLALTPQEERDLCSSRREALRQLVRVVGAEVEVDATGDFETTMTACRRSMGGLKSASLRRMAGRLVRAIDRLTWRLALSGTQQLQHQLARRRYQRTERTELQQAGLEGMFRAATKFDDSKGVRFSTYCRFWIKDAMGECVGRLEYAVRVPSKARRQLRHGKNLSDRQERALHAVRHAVDLDAPCNDDEGTYRMLLPANAPSPEEDLSQRQATERLGEALESAPLDERERTIVALRFGLGGRERCTNREIGDQFGISGERVRQLQNRALDKLRVALMAA